MQNRLVGTLIVVTSVAVTSAVGCESLTREEAAAALEEIEVASQASALTSSSIEISTNFTIGDAAAVAATELGSFIESQMPCAAVTVAAGSVTVEYGANSGSCAYRGQQYAGTHQMTVMRNEMSEVIVEHTWTDFHNDTVSVSGTATVTWSFENPARQVDHTITWTRMSDGRTGVGSGSRVQRPLEGGLLTGFSVDGDRTWEGESGVWTLDIDEVQMRWVDAVPQSGTYTLVTPAGKMLALSFARASSTTITVTVASGMRSFDFNVVTLPSEE